MVSTMTTNLPCLHLLLIDAQNDFCDLPASAQGAPALPVPGADADLRRVAELLRRAADRIDALTLTLDTHHRRDIAHPGFWWAHAPGQEVAPFTPITAAQVRAGRFQPRDPAALPRVLAYLDALEAQGRYTLMSGRCTASWAPGAISCMRPCARPAPTGNCAASARATSSSRA